MKIAFITDTHLGARNGNKPIRDHQMKYWQKFISDVSNQGIKQIVHLGDFFDSRTALTHQVLSDANQIISWLENTHITMNVIVGNHDVPNKNNNENDAIDSVLKKSNSINCLDDFMDLRFPDWSSLFVCPWVNKENNQQFLEALQQTKAKYCVGHFDILGGKFSKHGNPSVHGIEPKTFAKFDRVFSGHFHTKSTIGNIEYLGAPFEYTWVDWNDPKGYHIFDTVTGELNFIENPDKLFYQINIDDNGAKCIPSKPDSFVGKFVKVNTNITDQKKLNKISESLGEVADLQVTVLQQDTVIEDIKVGSIENMLEDSVQSVPETHRDGVLGILKSALEGTK